jgi:hypothetical protein
MRLPVGDANKEEIRPGLVFGGRRPGRWLPPNYAGPPKGGAAGEVLGSTRGAAGARVAPPGMPGMPGSWH